MMKLSEEGTKFLTLEEGKKLKIYLDSVGLPTCGIGHLIVSTDPEHGKPVGTPITEERCMELFRNDVGPTENAVNSFVKIPLKQSQFDSLVSLVFNIGKGAFRKSTILKKLNDNLIMEASYEFPRWAAKQKELMPRRMREKALFLS